MAELREVRILIGRRNYRMQTTLDEGTLERITALVEEAGEHIGTGVDQDNLLMLTCLQLAYTLDKVAQHLQPVRNKLKDTDPQAPIEGN